MLFAKALYANHADTQEELSFVAGDVLTVLEKDVSGLVGWWLCSLAGRTGIAPGNRLRLLTDPESPVKAAAPGRPIGVDGSTTAGRGRTALQASQTASGDGNTRNAAVEGSTLKVPHKSGNVYIYDNIQNIKQQQQQQQQQAPVADYDFPTPHYTIVASSSSAGSSNCSSPNSSTPPVRTGGSGLGSPPRRDVTRSAVTSVVVIGSQDGDYDVPVPFDCSPTSVVSSNRSSLVSIQSGASSSSARSCQSAATAGSGTRVVGRRQQHQQQTPTTADGSQSARSSDGHDSALEDYAAPRGVGVSGGSGCDSAQSSDSGISSVSSSCSSSSSRDAAGKKFFEDTTDGGGAVVVQPFDVEYGTMNDYDIPMPHYTVTSAVDASQSTSSMPRRPCVTKEETPVTVVVVQQSSCPMSSSHDGDYDELPSIVDVSHQMDYRPIQNYIDQDYRRKQQQLQQQQQQHQQQQEQWKQMQLTQVRCQLGLLRDNVIRSVGRFLGWTTALTSATDSHSPTGDATLAASTSRQWFGQVKMAGLSVKTSLQELVNHLMASSGSDVDATLRQNVDQLRSRLADIEHHLESVFSVGRTRTSTLRGRTVGCSSTSTVEPPDAAKIDAVRRLAGMISDLPRLVQQIVDVAAGITLPSSLPVGKSNCSDADVQLSNGPPATSLPLGRPANGGYSPPERQPKSSICSSYSSTLEQTVRGKPPPVKPKPPKSVTWKKPEVRIRTPDPPSISDLADVVDGCNDEVQNGQKTKTHNGVKKSPAVYGEGWTDDTCDYVSIVRQVEREMDATVAPAVPRRTASIDAARLPPISPPRQHRPPTAVTSTPVPQPLNDSDRELIAFYAAQIDSHSAVLAAATAEFYRCMTSSGTSSSPDVFVRRSRLVVLAAHKLVYVGDAIARHVTDQVVRDRVASAANALCDRLKAVVVATKDAALADAVCASQRRCFMVDCIQRATDCSRRLGDVIYGCTSG